MAAFKQHCVFGFWKGSLILGGKHKGATRHFGRITLMHDLPNQKMLIGCVRRAAELNEAGTRKSGPRPRAKREINVPADLKAALQRKVKARKTFENFRYSHKKEYVDWITDAKRDETRRRRLETAIQWLAQGNPQNWKISLISQVRPRSSSRGAKCRGRRSPRRPCNSRTRQPEQCPTKNCRRTKRALPAIGSSIHVRFRSRAWRTEAHGAAGVVHVQASGSNPFR